MNDIPKAFGNKSLELLNKKICNIGKATEKKDLSVEVKFYGAKVFVTAYRRSHNKYVLRDSEENYDFYKQPPVVDSIKDIAEFCKDVYEKRVPRSKQLTIDSLLSAAQR